MQASVDNGADLEIPDKLAEDLQNHLTLTEESVTQNMISQEEVEVEEKEKGKGKEEEVEEEGKEEEVDENEEEDEEEVEDEEEEEFSFMCVGGDTSPITAEEAFINGQIKPIYPLFNRDLLLGEIPQVKNMFVEMNGDTVKMTLPSSENEEVTGPAPEVCKKSNSTGFSKLWRFKDLLHRSNSDGRDTFVFLKEQPTTSSDGVEVKVNKKGKKPLTTSSDIGEVKVDKKVKKSGKKGKTATLSPHEIYLQNKAKESGDRRRSYLPYRQGVFGVFTNVNGGMSRNVHPF